MNNNVVKGMIHICVIETEHAYLSNTVSESACGGACMEIDLCYIDPEIGTISLATFMCNSRFHCFCIVDVLLFMCIIREAFQSHFSYRSVDVTNNKTIENYCVTQPIYRMAL